MPEDLTAWEVSVREKRETSRSFPYLFSFPLSHHGLVCRRNRVQGKRNERQKGKVTERSEGRDE